MEWVNEQYKSRGLHRKRKITTPKHGNNSAKKTVIIIDEDDALDSGDTLREMMNSNLHFAQPSTLLLEAINPNPHSAQPLLSLPEVTNPKLLSAQPSRLKNFTLSKREGVKNTRKRTETILAKKPSDSTQQNFYRVKTAENETVNKNTKDSIRSQTNNLMEGTAQNGKFPIKDKQEYQDTVEASLIEPDTVIFINDDSLDLVEFFSETKNLNSHLAQPSLLPNTTLSTCEEVMKNSECVEAFPEKRPSDLINEKPEDSIRSQTNNLMEGTAQNSKLPVKDETKPKQPHKDEMDDIVDDIMKDIINDPDILLTKTDSNLTQNIIERMIVLYNRVMLKNKRIIPKQDSSLANETVIVIDDDDTPDSVPVNILRETTNPNPHFTQPSLLPNATLSISVNSHSAQPLRLQNVVLSKSEGVKITSKRSETVLGRTPSDSTQQTSDEIRTDQSENEAVNEKAKDSISSQVNFIEETAQNGMSTIVEHRKDEVEDVLTEYDTVIVIDDDSLDSVHSLSEITNSNSDFAESPYLLSEETTSNSAQSMEISPDQQYRDWIVLNESDTVIINDDDTMDLIRNSYSDSDSNEVVQPSPLSSPRSRIISEEVVMETPMRKRKRMNNRKRQAARMPFISRIKHNFEPLQIFLNTKGSIPIPFHGTSPKQRLESLKTNEDKRNSIDCDYIIEDASEDEAELTVGQPVLTVSQMLNLEETLFTNLQNFALQTSYIDGDGTSPTNATNSLSSVEEAPEPKRLAYVNGNTSSTTSELLSTEKEPATTTNSLSSVEEAPESKRFAYVNGNTSSTTSELVLTEKEPATTTNSLNPVEKALEPLRPAKANGNITPTSELVSTTKDRTTIALNPVQKDPEQHRLSNEYFIYVPYFKLQQVTLKTRSQESLCYKNSKQSKATIVLPNNGYYKKLNIFNDSLRFLFGLSNREWNCVNNLLQFVNSFEYIAKAEQSFDASLAAKILYLLFETLPTFAQVTLEFDEQAMYSDSSDNDVRCLTFDTNCLRPVGSSLTNALDPYILERMKAAKKKAPVSELLSIGPVPLANI